MAITAKATSKTVYVMQESSGSFAANASDLATAIALANEMKQVLINAGLGT